VGISFSGQFCAVAGSGQGRTVNHHAK